jgi:hypothetical protein
VATPITPSRRTIDKNPKPLSPESRGIYDAAYAKYAPERAVDDRRQEKPLEGQWKVTLKVFGGGTRLEILHASCLVLVAGFVAAYGTHLVVVIVVLIGVFSHVSGGIFLHIFW